FPDVSGSLAQINGLFARLIRQDYDPNYTNRTNIATQLSNFIINAPFGSEITSPQTAIIVLITYELALEGALEDLSEFLSGTAEFKKSIIRIITALGFAFRYGATPFFQWIFDRLLTQRPQSTKEQDVNLKLGLLNVLREILDLSFVPNPPKNLHQHLIGAIMNNMQTFLDTTNLPDLLLPAIDVISSISEKYPSSFEICFKDFVSLLIGWNIDPKIPKPIANSISDSFQKFSVTWKSHVIFGLEVIRDLTTDMENAYFNQPQFTDPVQDRVSMKVLALQKCCAGITKAVCLTIFDPPNPTINLETNLKIKNDFCETVEYLGALTLRIGQAHPGDRFWKATGIEWMKFITVSVHGECNFLHSVVIELHSLEVDIFIKEIQKEMRDSEIGKFVDNWLRELENIMSAWTRVDEDLINFFISPLTSPFLSKVRLLCTRDKATTANFLRSLNSNISLIIKSKSPISIQFDILLEMVDIVHELKARRKVADYYNPNHDTFEILRNLLNEAQTLSYETHINQLREAESATIKYAMLFDISLAIECVTLGIFEGTTVFSCLDAILLPDIAAEYVYSDWWVKLESALFLEVYQLDHKFVI
ncbi:Serine/threonine-protein kinase smg1, partial [Physocladia obscura]